MKKILLGLGLLFNMAMYGQQPVTWNYSVQKIKDKVFELHCTAIIQPGWHLYAQRQPEDAIAQPTSITFNKNPLLEFNGNIKEVGKLEKYQNKELQIENWQYAQKVDFVQEIILKNNAETSVSGKIQFQACTNEKCLPPATKSFEVTLKG
jgi:hypothetical protein